MHTRAHRIAEVGIGIAAHAGHHGEVLPLQGVFGEDPRHPFGPDERAIHEGLVKGIVLKTETGFQLITALPHQHLVDCAGIHALLCTDILPSAKARGGIVPPRGEHDPDALRWILLENETLFTEHIHQFVPYVDHIGITGVDGVFGIVHAHRRLPSDAFIHHVPHTELRHTTFGAPHPAIHHVEPARSWRIHETIVVLVHVLLEQVAVQQKQVATIRTRTLGKVYVPFQAPLRVAVHVHEDRWFIQWIEQAEVDLSGHGIGAIHRGADALTEVDVLDPRARYERKAIGSGEAADEGQILQADLRILAFEPEHADGLRAGNGIAIVHIHRGIGLETFTEVTAGRTFQLLLPDDLGGNGAS